MKHIVSRMSSYFPKRWPLSYLNLIKNMKTYIRRQQHTKNFKHQDIKQKEPPQKYRLGTISKPDLRLVNTVETHKTLGSKDLLVTVNRNGIVLWEPGHRLKTLYCTVLIQECTPLIARIVPSCFQRGFILEMFYNY